MVIYHVGKVIGRHTICFYQDLIIQHGIVHRNVAKHFVMEGRGTLQRHLLADDIRHAGGKFLLNLLFGEAAAMAVVLWRHAGRLLNFFQFIQTVLVTEAVVGMPALNQLEGIFFKHPHPLTLHVWAVRTADIRSLVPVESCLTQGVVNNVDCAFHIAFPVGIFNAEDKFPIVFFR